MEESFTNKNASHEPPAPPSVLVVDDQEPIRETMVITLRREGYETQAAESGEQALEIISRRHFDLVITDLRLAGMDGIRVLKQVKVKSPDTEVVVITGYGTIEGAVDAIKSGAYDYLTKPFQPEELTLVARRALERKDLSQKAGVLEEAVRGLAPPTWHRWCIPNHEGCSASH